MRKDSKRNYEGILYLGRVHGAIKDYIASDLGMAIFLCDLDLEKLNTQTIPDPR